MNDIERKNNQKPDDPFLYCKLLTKQCNDLKQKLNIVTDELEALKGKKNKRRENSTPITVLLSIDKDATIANHTYNILEKELKLITQCHMLLNCKNKTILKKVIKIPPINIIPPKDINAIKLVINNYYQTSQSIATVGYQPHHEQFIFYVIYQSISICGRTKAVVTNEYWKCVHYLRIFMYHQIKNFEKYISRFIPSKMSEAIIEDLIRQYNPILSDEQFSNSLRTLKNVINSFNKQTMVNKEFTTSQQVAKENDITDITPVKIEKNNEHKPSHFLYISAVKSPTKNTHRTVCTVRKIYSVEDIAEHLVYGLWHKHKEMKNSYYIQYLNFDNNTDTIRFDYKPPPHTDKNEREHKQYGSNWTGWFKFEGMWMTQRVDIHIHANDSSRQTCVNIELYDGQFSRTGKKYQIGKPLKDIGAIYGSTIDKRVLTKWVTNDMIKELRETLL